MRSQARGMKLLLGGSVRGRRYGRATGIGAFWENVVGQAVLDDGLRARACSVVAPATCPVALRARIRRCRLPALLPRYQRRGGGRGENARESDRIGCAPGVLRGRDRRGGRAALGGQGRDHPGTARAVFAEAWAGGFGGAPGGGGGPG